MDFHHVIQAVPKIQNVSLPALEAHVKMAPLARLQALRNYRADAVNARQAAVMMLLYPKHNQTQLLFIIRTSDGGVHSNQIAFPGGKKDATDFDLMQTALRETEEEVGVYASKVKVVRHFSEVYIPPSNYLVHPFLGYCEDKPEFRLQETEVAGIVECPLHEVFNEQAMVIQNLRTSYADSIEVPAFQLQNHLIWGATAMMLSELKDVMKKVL